MPTPDQDKQELARSIGHLEGRQDSLEKRVERHEQVTERWFGELMKKIDGLGDSIEKLHTDQASRDGQLKGGKQVMIVIWTGVVAIASLLVAVWKYILHSA